MPLFHKKRKLHVVPKLLGSCLVLIVVVVAISWYMWKNISPVDILNTDFVRDTVVKQIGEEKEFLFDLMPTFLGFSEPQTYLVLLLNNTELRPGGGFIGTYATIRVDQGNVEVIALDGTENLDKHAPVDWRVDPPAPIREYLGLDRWYFRDSNWSPDFRTNAERAIEFYTAEGGVVAADIDGVIGVTPTVLEEILHRVGPITVEGITFTGDTVTEVLEYQVEYAYADQGIAVEDRKKIIAPLLLSVLSQLKEHAFTDYAAYLQLAESLAEEKHILFYHTDPEDQAILESQGWGGRMEVAEDDYVLWVDANLGALKTDHALERQLQYNLLGKEQGRYKAQVTMEYAHTGQFDWRTSRYITYARVFVPEGSTLVGVEGRLKSGARITTDMVDIGVEQGKQWFGTMFSIEPQQVKSLSYTYLLPEHIGEDGVYELLVQKQLGSVDHTLTLDLDFATLLRTADPPEQEEEWYDGVYRYTTDLTVDRGFGVQL